MLCLLLCLGSLSALAQQPNTVSGTVKDDAGVAMTSVTVSVKNGKPATVTDAYGKFTLKNVKPGAMLVFSSIGFSTIETKATTEDVNIVLKTANSSMNEVIVTALGIKREAKSLGYSDQKVSGNDVMKPTRQILHWV